MLCEICHQRDADQVIVRKEEGVDQERYVCKACAHDEVRFAKHVVHVAIPKNPFQSGMQPFSPDGRPIPPEELAKLEDVLKVIKKTVEGTGGELTVGQPLAPDLQDKGRDEGNQPHCTQCESTLEQIIERGQMGCAACYRDLGKQIQALFASDEHRSAARYHGQVLPRNFKIWQDEILHQELTNALAQGDYAKAREILALRRTAGGDHA